MASRAHRDRLRPAPGRLRRRGPAARRGDPEGAAGGDRLGRPHRPARRCARASRAAAGERSGDRPAFLRGAGRGVGRTARCCSSPATTTTGSPSRCSRASPSPRSQRWAWSTASARRWRRRSGSTRWLGATELCVAYPGAWLRRDVYATHGHYMDCHMSLPRLECIAAAAVMKAGKGPPDPAGPGDYERVLRPVYGLAFGLAQSGLSGGDEPPLRTRLALALRPAPRQGPRPPRGDPRRHRRRGAGERLGAQPTAEGRLRHRPLPRRDHPQRDRRSHRAGAAAGGRRRPRDHRTHPPRRTARGRGRVAAARRRAPPQHRQLDLRLRLPPPGNAARPLLAGHGHLGRGRGSRRGASSCSPDTRGTT